MRPKIVTSRGFELSYRAYVTLGILLLALLYAALGPSASDGLGPGSRLAFWIVHGFSLLACLLIAQGVLLRLWPALADRSIVMVTAGAVLGSAIFALIAVPLERAFFAPPYEPLIWEAGGVAAAVTEFGHVIAPVLVSWLALHAPMLLGLAFVDPRSRQGEAAAEPETPSAGAATQPGAGLLSKLPAKIGRDVVAVSSELHYVRVYTPRGSTLILHAMKAATADLAEIRGAWIHRSHWIALAHLHDIRSVDGQRYCVLSNGLELPISRRRHASVAADLEAALAMRRATTVEAPPPASPAVPVRGREQSG
jgi:hypothetical protein